MRIKLLLACTAILIGGASSSPTIAAAETLDKDYVDFTQIHNNAWSSIVAYPKTELPLSGVLINSPESSYYESTMNLDCEIVTRVDSIDGHYVTRVDLDPKTSNSNYIYLDNIQNLMNFTFSFNFTEEYINELISTPIESIKFSIDKYGQDFSSLTFSTTNVNKSTNNSFNVNFSSLITADVNSDRIIVRWYYVYSTPINIPEYVKFDSFSLQYAKYNESLPAVTYDGRELTDRAVSVNTDIAFEENDYYYLVRERKYFEDTDSYSLDSITAVFNQASTYLPSNYIMHFDFYDEVFSGYIQIQVETWDEGVNFTIPLYYNETSRKGFNIIIPFQVECHITITTLHYDSLRDKYYDNSSILKSVSILPYILKNYLGDNQLFYFASSNLFLDLDYVDSSDIAYETGYSNGQSDGYKDGYEEGYDKGDEDGYANGYKAGEEFGYAIGKKETANWWTDFIDFWNSLWESIKRLFVEESE